MRARAILLTAASCALALALAACTKTKTREPTAVVVAIQADPMVRAAINAVHVEIASGSSKSDLETRAEERFDLRDDVRWPLTLTLVPKTSGTDVFRIWVRAQNGQQEISELRVISGFAPERVLLLEVLLPDECIGILSCDIDQTCTIDEDDGIALCGDAEVPVASLVPFTERVIDRLRNNGQLDGGSGPADSGMPKPDGGDEPKPDGGDEPDPDGSVTPNDPERCDNGDDDDGDGDVDCADDDCTPGFTCAPAGDEQAVVLTDTSESCPSDFEDLGVVSNELIYGTSCTGCGCTATQAVGCTASVYFFASNDECNAVGADSAGLFVGNATNTCGTPIGDQEGLASPFGWRVGDTAPESPASCEVTGAPEVVPPRWRRERKLCRASSELPAGGGCEAGFVCVPRVATESGSQCAILPAGEACTGGSGEDWYEGFDDNRSCRACACTLQGGDCDAATARLGSDWECAVSSPGLLTEGQRSCFGGSSIYYPSADVLGTPSTATCSAAASTTGRIDLLGGRRICCP